MRKLWGGAFGEDSDSLADRFGQSIDDDLEFWAEDVEGSIAHAQMLGSTGILTRDEAQTLVGGLRRILDEGPDSLPQDVEDIHTAVESRLRELVGDVAGKLHTARSRNDQVATDARLALRKRLRSLSAEIKRLQTALIATAEAHVETRMPGVTHQQHAQPITLGFHAMAAFFAYQRHGWRVENCLKTIETCPLGSAALAGTGFPIDREMTAKALGFEAPTPNALDATSDRSFVLDALHVCSLLMLELSRSAQELVNWAGPEYGFVSLPDSLTTGSSIMPQKRNPDMAELIRGRTGRAVGHWVAVATMMKGLVYGYNRDTQEDKPPLFDSLRLTHDALALTTAMFEGASWHIERMAAATTGDLSTATDLADALAEAGMPFRQAHEVVGRVVRGCLERRIGLEDLDPESLGEIAPEVDPALLARLTPAGSVAARESIGGTGPKSVSAQVARGRELLQLDEFSSLF